MSEDMKDIVGMIVGAGVFFFLLLTPLIAGDYYLKKLRLECVSNETTTEGKLLCIK